MKQACHSSLITPTVQEAPSNKPCNEKAQAPGYRAPRLYIIGKAIDLVQGYSYGKYSDGYTGYYWER
jgi:hypothetical protein